MKTKKLTPSQMEAIVTEVCKRISEQNEKLKKEALKKIVIPKEDLEQIKKYQEIANNINKKYKKGGYYSDILRSKDEDIKSIEQDLRERVFRKTHKKLCDAICRSEGHLHKEIKNHLIISQINGSVSGGDLIEELVKKFSFKP